MTTEIHAIVYQNDGKLSVGPLCKTRECAEKSVSPFEGALVVGVLSGTLDALPEPVMGMRYVLERAAHG